MLISNPVTKKNFIEIVRIISRIKILMEVSIRSQSELPDRGPRCLAGLSKVITTSLSGKSLHYAKAVLFLFSFVLKARQQVFPPKPEDETPLTRLQERLLKKLGKNAYPFKFQVCL